MEVALEAAEPAPAAPSVVEAREVRYCQELLASSSSVYHFHMREAGEVVAP
jgi:hypothetical protein